MSQFKQFYSALFFTALLPYLPYIFTFLPGQLLGFNWTGWAWIAMLLVTLVQLLKTHRIHFPVWLWLPWMVYITVYLAVDFSIMGLQLTLQYLLPLLIGLVASGFTYSELQLRWLFKWFTRLCIIIIALFVIGYIFRGGYTPAAAATPMLLSIAASLVAGIYYLAKDIKYLVYFGLLFLVPFIDVTRMGIAAFLAIFILHFANRKIGGKILYGLLGLLVVVLVFNTKGFQEKTFYEGHGRLSDLSVNYYENETLNSNGRRTWQIALEPGIKVAPILGNGPRADLDALLKISNNQIKEAHNDYLSIRYNYGYLGLVLLLYGFGLTFISIFLRLRNETSILNQLLGTSTLTLFISFLMFMYSDNILKYTIYFPDFFFAMIGIFYSINKGGLEEEA